MPAFFLNLLCLALIWNYTGRIVALTTKSSSKAQPLVSVVVVSYNVRAFLEQALNSIRNSLIDITHEIFVVDNASSDGSPELVAEKFPDVKLIANKVNIGFGAANNLAFKKCSGDYVAIVNPDTIVQEDTFSTLVKFFREHSDAGAAGCKILNPDGSLQLACRRSFPSPWTAFTKMIGLAHLFPKSKLFGRYNLTFLDPDQTYPVEAISGSFMLVKREVLQTVGYFDETFFMYGEDLDLCYRINEAGYKIYYVSDTQIIHFKGESSKKSPFEQRRLFYEAMHHFVKKHFRGTKAFIPSWLLIGAIWARAVLAFLQQLLSLFAVPAVDFLFLSISLSIAIFLRFRPDFPWAPFLLVHFVYSLVWLFSLSVSGCYRQWKYSGSKALFAAVTGLVINSALTYFFKQYGFSRAVVLLAGLFNLFLLPGWRIALKWLAENGSQFWAKNFGHILLNRRTAIVGDVSSVKSVIERMKSQVGTVYNIVGVVIYGKKADLEGENVLGEFNRLDEIIDRERIQEVIFSTDKIPYHRILRSIGSSKARNAIFKLVPSNLDVIIGKASIEYLNDIPLMDLDYRLFNVFNRIFKRLFDIALAALLLVLFAPIYLWYKTKKVPVSEILIESNGGKSVTLHKFRSKSKFVSGLPLLFAILKGHISFVGRDLSDPKPASTTASSLVPGLTGLVQTSSRQGMSAADKERLYIFYIKNYSPLFDLEILLNALLNKKHKY